MRRKFYYKEINPEDIFIDSTNLPGFDEARFEGRMEKPISRATFLGVKIVLIILVLVLGGKLWELGVKDNHIYAEISEKNRLEQTLIFANRGVVYDRHMVELAANTVKEGDQDFAARVYAPIKGLAHVVGYLKYPAADKQGIYYETEYRGVEGVEMAYDGILKGENGKKLIETDVHGDIVSEAVISKPRDGSSLVLSIDAHVNEVMYNAIANLAETRGFVGGAGVIMDVETGELIVMTSFPEYDQNAMTSGTDQETFNALISDERKPFLNRAIGGLYTPGSIIKPIIALGALNEGIISPLKNILSTGSITVPNPYDPSKPSVFGDWKAHGYTDMREAIAVSSDTYFYAIGGGYGDQKGLGITLIDKYLSEFGLTKKTGIELRGEVFGVIPTPDWKKEKFNGDIWRLGDTYITSIGQYGTLVTPLTAARFTAAVANKGKLLSPSLLLGGDSEPVEETLEFNDADWKVVHDGMRGAVEYGTAAALNVPYVNASAKTGTAEVGAGKKYVHSWSVGFWPSENPKYAWAIIMEKGPATNTIGASSVMRQVFDWMSINTPEYFEPGS